MNLKRKISGLLRQTSIQNGMWMYGLQIFNTVIPLLTLPYITRILGDAGYGQFVFALNIIGYLQVFIEYGFPMSATRKVVACNQDREKISNLFSSILYARLTLLVVSFVILLGVMFFLGEDTTRNLCMLVLTVCLVGSCLSQNWLFQGMQKMKYISVISIVGRLFSVVLIFLLVKSKEDLLLYCLLYGVSLLLSGIIGTVMAKNMFSLSLRRPSFERVRKELMDGFYVFTTSLSSKVFGAIGVTFLGIFATDEVVGVYGAIQKIPQTIMMAWAPISQVLYPITSQKMMQSYADGLVFVKKMRRIFLVPFILLSVVIGVFHRQIIGFAFGDEYVSNAVWVIPLLLWMIISINNNFLGVQTLLGSGRDKEYSACFQLGVICTVVLNFAFIYFGGGLGAAFAPALSEMILGIALWGKIRKIKD